MLVVLGPNFDGSDTGYARLSRATSMLPYDLKARIKPGAWGVVKALADESQAYELAQRIQLEGFEPLLLPHSIAEDVTRHIVPIRAIELGEREMTLFIDERPMPVPYAALVCIVRGEVQPGRVGRRSITPTSSSGAFRAVTPSVVHEAQSKNTFQAFAAADLHFATVLWIGRIDARSFDFRVLGQPSESAAADLEQLVEHLANVSGVRVDRAVRSSSLASFVDRPTSRSSTPPPSSLRGRELAGDERFDPYSRLIGEAERKLALGSLR